MSSESENTLTDPMRGRSVFVSYKREDDAPPPENPSPDFGFVRYLSRQLNYELKQLGVPDEILWRDRAKIAPADDWSEVIRQELHRADLFLAVVSRNYIRSKWCKDEVLTMAQRIETLDTSVRDRRIFRVDKQR